MSTAESACANPATLPDDRLEAREGWWDRHGLVTAIVGLLAFFFVLVFWPKAVITIHAGEEGVLWRRFTGTDLDVIMLEGTHLILPWDILYVYDVRFQKVDYTVPVLSTDGLEINVDVTIRYRPVAKEVPQLHQSVGPFYVGTIVIPEVVTAVREIMGKYRPEQLYTLRTDEMQSQIVARASREVRERFVIIDDVLIRRIQLPTAVQQAIQRKLNQEQEALEYIFRLDKENREAERKVIEANGIARFQTIVRSTINADLLRWKGIEATLELARSPNAKVVIVGSGANGGLPVILNFPETAAGVAAASTPALAETPSPPAPPSATTAMRNAPPPQ